MAKVGTVSPPSLAKLVARQVRLRLAGGVDFCRGLLGSADVRVRGYIDEYAKHSALNLGQALQGVRYLASHPDIDARAARGSLRHAALSLVLRSRRVANDLLFASLPPRWHHSREELAVMASVSIARWFQYGYCAWRFEETGEPRSSLVGVDRRWDPRCTTTPTRT